MRNLRQGCEWCGEKLGGHVYVFQVGAHPGGRRFSMQICYKCEQSISRVTSRAASRVALALVSQIKVVRDASR